MRTMLLIPAALLGLSVAAHAQTTTGQPTPITPDQVAPGPATPAPATPANQTPLRHRNPLRHRPTHATAGQPADIRPGHIPGVGDSEPASSTASNIDPGDTGSVIAPRLPVPAGGQNLSIGQLLSDANRAVAAHRTGLAQSALERAETAMLDRSVPPDAAATPSQQPDVLNVTQARDALGHGDFAGAQRAIAAAMNAGR